MPGVDEHFGRGASASSLNGVRDLRTFSSRFPVAGDTAPTGTHQLHPITFALAEQGSTSKP